MDFPTDLVLLNTLFPFPLAYHTVGVNSITLADVLCQRLQIYRVAVWLDDVFSHRKTLNSTNKQASPFGDVKFGVAGYVNHHCANHKTDIGNEFAQCAPNTS